MIRIALAVVAAVGLTFAADAQIGPLCQTPDGNLIVCHLGRGSAAQIGPSLSDPRWQSGCLSHHARRTLADWPPLSRLRMAI